MKIGHIEFPDKPVFLAPMEDVSDIGCRLFCRQFGVDMVYTEFISSDALIRDIKKTKQKTFFSKEERPIGMQIYGSDPDTMVEAAKICEEADPDLIDINFGCPVKKISTKGAGSGMMRTPDIMLDITRNVVKAVNKPVTVKTRLGWDDNSKIIVELAEKLQDCGIAALTLHGRTRAQMYKGEADWSLIAAVKNNSRMHIPIIGNGDVTTPERALECFNRYGVDAVMIGRGSIGRPWFFAEVKHYFETGELNSLLSFEEQKEVLKEHVIASVRWLDIDENTPIERVYNQRLKGIIHRRRHLAATPVFKGIPNFKDTRIEMLRAETLNELFRIIDSVQPGDN